MEISRAGSKKVKINKTKIKEINYPILINITVTWDDKTVGNYVFVIVFLIINFVMFSCELNILLNKLSCSIRRNGNITF